VLNTLRWRLSADEAKRAAAFCFERDRHRFVAARGFLREILGRYLRAAGEALSFEYGPHGKPALAGEFRDALRFNVSHSGEMALYAVTLQREVGVDIEALREVNDAEQIAERFFSPAERVAFRLQAPGQRQQAFFNCWTRKEAYLKALGDGLARPLDGFDVTLAPGEPARLLRVEGEPRESERWSLRELLPARGYVGAVAVEGHGWRLTCGEWNPAITEGGDGSGDERRRRPGLPGRGESRGAVLDLAGRPGAARGVARRGENWLEGRVPRPRHGGLDRHAAARRAEGSGR